MKKPNYVLKTNEAVLKPVGPGKLPDWLRKSIGVILIILIIGSIIFKDNLFAKLPWFIQIVFIVLCIFAPFSGPKKDYFPSEIEIQFFDDYFVFYRPKMYYDKRTTRKEICVMRYAEVTECVYKNKSQRIHIYGNGTTTWWNYKKDGTLPNNPTKVNPFTRGLLFFSTRYCEPVNLIKEIEEHSPIRVIEENN